MKYVPKEKKEKTNKTYEFELKSPNSNSYSLSVLIKKEVINLLQLEAGDKLEITIKEFDDVIGYDLRFIYADETKNISIPIDELTSKTTKKDNKTVLDVTLFSPTYTENNKFRINVVSPSAPKITIRDEETKEDITTVRVGDRIKSEVDKIIEDLKNCETINEINETADKYRK